MSTFQLLAFLLIITGMGVVISHFFIRIEYIKLQKKYNTTIKALKEATKIIEETDSFLISQEDSSLVNSQEKYRLLTHNSQFKSRLNNTYNINL